MWNFLLVGAFNNEKPLVGSLRDCENFAKVRFQSRCAAKLVLCFSSPRQSSVLPGDPLQEGGHSEVPLLPGQQEARSWSSRQVLPRVKIRRHQDKLRNIFQSRYQLGNTTLLFWKLLFVWSWYLCSPIRLQYVETTIYRSEAKSWIQSSKVMIEISQQTAARSQSCHLQHRGELRIPNLEGFFRFETYWTKQRLSSDWGRRGTDRFFKLWSVDLQNFSKIFWYLCQILPSHNFLFLNIDQLNFHYAFDRHL